MIVIPLVGTALDHRHAPLAFVLLAAFVAGAGLLNLTAPAVASQPAAAEPAGSSASS